MLSKVREQARTVGCQANLRQWGIASTMYAESNSGKLWSGIAPDYWYWPYQLPEELRCWKENKTWFCPTATKLQVDERGVSAPMLNIFNAWGIYKEAYQGYSAGHLGIAGSYGLNSYLLSRPLTTDDQRRRFWGTLSNVPQASTVPLFIDSLRFDLWPLETTAPARTSMPPGTMKTWPAAASQPAHRFCRLCVLWTPRLQGGRSRSCGRSSGANRSQHTRPLTQAGGVDPRAGPEWIRPLKDFERTGRAPDDRWAKAISKALGIMTLSACGPRTANLAYGIGWRTAREAKLGSGFEGDAAFCRRRGA